MVEIVETQTPLVELVETPRKGFDKLNQRWWRIGFDKLNRR